MGNHDNSTLHVDEKMEDLHNIESYGTHSVAVDIERGKDVLGAVGLHCTTLLDE
jgi:hypothetical protein